MKRLQITRNKTVIEVEQLTSLKTLYWKLEAPHLHQQGKFLFSLCLLLLWRQITLLVLHKGSKLDIKSIKMITFENFLRAL